MRDKIGVICRVLMVLLLYSNNTHVRHVYIFMNVDTCSDLLFFATWCNSCTTKWSKSFHQGGLLCMSWQMLFNVLLMCLLIYLSGYSWIRAIFSLQRFSLSKVPPFHCSVVCSCAAVWSSQSCNPMPMFSPPAFICAVYLTPTLGPRWHVRWAR